MGKEEDQEMLAKQKAAKEATKKLLQDKKDSGSSNHFTVPNAPKAGKGFGGGPSHGTMRRGSAKGR